MFVLEVRLIVFQIEILVTNNSLSLRINRLQINWKMTAPKFNCYNYENRKQVKDADPENRE